MEQWKIDAIKTLLSGDTVAKEVSETRSYLYSPYFGESRYHMLTLRFDGDVVIDQIDIGEKYQQRVILEAQEVAPMLSTLLTWYLRAVEQQEQRDQAVVSNDELGDVDEHPF